MASPKTRPAPNSSPARLAVSVGLLALLVVVIYWSAMQHGFVNYDDDRYVTANAQVQKGLTLENIRWAFVNPVADNWHPVTVLSHMLVCQFCQLNPGGHHLVNVLLHAANTALVFLLMRQLTGAHWKSLAVAALFAVHPLRVESVAWVAERKDVLSGFFGLLSLIFYARHAQAQKLKRPGRVYFSRSYWLAWLWFALGLMSKPMLVTWPFVLLLLDYWPLKRISSPEPQTAKRARPERLQLTLGTLLVEKIPFLILAVATSVVTFAVQQHGAAVETIQNLPWSARCENALIAYVRYLGKIFWPTDLAVLYPHPGNWPTADVFLAAALLIGVSALAIIFRRSQPYFLVGWLWFLGTLISVIGLIQVGSQSMADRYTYLPSLGILILVVWGAYSLTKQWRNQVAILSVAVVTALVFCVVATRTQLQYWQDGETLFRHTLAVTKNNPIAHYNLGAVLDEKGRDSEAIAEYQATIAIQPANTLALLNLGADLDKTGRPDEAAIQYQEVIRLEPDNTKAHNNLGVILFHAGKIVEATREFQEAVRLTPGSAEAHNSLAAAFFMNGQMDEAIQEFNETLRLRPAYPEAHFNLACILAKRGQTDEAIKHFQEVIRLKPDYPEARERLAYLLETRGKPN